MTLTNTYIRFIVFSLLVAVSHGYLYEHTDLKINQEQFYTIHLFNFLMSALSYPLLFISAKKMKEKLGFVFLGVSVFKMLLTLVYIGITIINKENVEGFALQFVFVYFVYLFYDSFIAIKTLNAH